MPSIDYDLFLRYVSGACTPFEQAQIDRLCRESPAYAQLAQAFRTVATDSKGLPEERKAAMLAAIKQPRVTAPAGRPAVSLDPPSPGSSRKPIVVVPRKLSWQPALRVVAGLVLLVAAAAIGRLAMQSRGAAPMSVVTGLRSFATAPGQRLALRLPDGTAVTLAPASVLRLSADYGTRKRVVDLEGEATFTVSHDPARPFVVQTSRGTAHDLGTRFTTMAYPDDSIVEVVVAEGSVAVRPDRAVAPRADSVVLQPGERVRITSAGQMTVTRGIALDPYFAWATGRLVFRDTPLREVAVRMSRWFDIDVRLASPEVGSYPLTATFDEGEAGDVLPLIAASLKLTLTQSGRTYVFHPR